MSVKLHTHMLIFGEIQTYLWIDVTKPNRPIYSIQLYIIFFPDVNSSNLSSFPRPGFTVCILCGLTAVAHLTLQTWLLLNSNGWISIFTELQLQNACYRIWKQSSLFFPSLIVLLRHLTVSELPSSRCFSDVIMFILLRLQHRLTRQPVWEL